MPWRGVELLKEWCDGGHGWRLTKIEQPYKGRWTCWLWHPGRKEVASVMGEDSLTRFLARETVAKEATR